MFDWFKRKTSSANPPEDRWSIATSEENGQIIIYRIRNRRPSETLPPDFPKLMAIQWKYESANDSGLPTELDSVKMSSLEDLLEISLEKNQQAFQTVIVTGKGIREWQWYAKDETETLRRINAALEGEASFPINIFFEDDPEWNAYARFKNVISKSQ